MIFIKHSGIFLLLLMVTGAKAQGLPTAGFNNTSACLGTATVFADGSVSPPSDPIVAWNWSFPGATPPTATVQNPTVLYASSGSHTVTLVVTTQLGYKDTIVQQIVIYTPPIVNFSGQDSGCAPVCLSFTDLSTSQDGQISSWQWLFHGTSLPAATNQNPSNICYSIPGTYSVSLIVTSIYGCNDTTTVYPMATVYPWPAAVFTYTVNGNIINLTNNSSGAANWNWNFGDGDTSSLQNPVHTYSFGNTYNVCLSTYSQYGCWDTICQTIMILGVDEINLSTSINILPSVSTSGIFTISVLNAAVHIGAIEAYDVTGHKLRELIANKENIPIDLSREKNGIYFVRIITDSGSVTKKVILAR